MQGKLYGIGVGPGDPELITLKAKRILDDIDVVLVPRTSADKSSTAMSIMEKVVDIKNKEVMELVFPMSSDKGVLDANWNESASKIKAVLDGGRNAAFITLGDPTVYSTYMYIHNIIKSKGYEAEIIPGITSFCAAAARAGISLAENSENIAIVPSAYELDDLDFIIDRFDNIVLMKVSGSMPGIREKLAPKGLADKAVIVSKCGFEDEKIYNGIEKLDDEKLSYFTTMIIKKGGIK